MEIIKLKNKPNMDCMVCGEELVYKQNNEIAVCYYCKKEFITNVSCKNGHFVCDKCHGKDGYSLIEEYCVNSDELNPLDICENLMNNKKINMHGPEHHFLVPAALLCSYFNRIGEKEKKKGKIAIAKTRAMTIPGGSCGYYGNCGAAVGAGIFMSIMTESTPLSEDSWAKCNEITGRILIHLAKMGGPRCCKRSVYTAITETNKFLEENFSITLIGKSDKIFCGYSKYNKQCIGNRCEYNLSNSDNKIGNK
ncbi:DUF5714 domain-containing protein [Clostridium fallax]|uniref:DUF5714 domain-containing protein n=1 Tax=Clostridium fallax TaxID=1533 RepID=A0A1M4UNE0_9CLOT|nr:DUF5714 domain-containing protein [Clostridium fallax]SHE58239.1 hypothetical protein SAMN05443638_105113 [Clostridium fallax]SQB07659.1 Uncharacterised protein [Clostridium fallax]